MRSDENESAGILWNQMTSDDRWYKKISNEIWLDHTSSDETTWDQMGLDKTRLDHMRSNDIR